MNFDLNQLDTTHRSNDGAELRLEHPTTGEKLDCHLILAGSDSTVFKNAQSAISTKYVKNMNKRRNMDLQTDKLELMARCTLGWRHMMVDGLDLPCTFDNALQIYTRFPWVYEQAEAFCTDRSNFLQN